MYSDLTFGEVKVQREAGRSQISYPSVNLKPKRFQPPKGTAKGKLMETSQDVVVLRGTLGSLAFQLSFSFSHSAYLCSSSLWALFFLNSDNFYVYGKKICSWQSTSKRERKVERDREESRWFSPLIPAEKNHGGFWFTHPGSQDCLQPVQIMVYQDCLSLGHRPQSPFTYKREFLNGIKRRVRKCIEMHRPQVWSTTNPGPVQEQEIKQEENHHLVTSWHIEVLSQLMLHSNTVVHLGKRVKL